MRNKIQYLLKRVVLFVPFFLVLGIFDYRFHNYYWSRFNLTRFLPGYDSYFDFFSIYGVFLVFFSFFTILFFLRDFKALKLLKRFRFKNVLKDRFSGWYLVFAWLLLGIVFSFFGFESVDPYIKSWFAQITTNYIIPVLTVGLILFYLRNRPQLDNFTLGLWLSLSFLAGLSLLQYYLCVFPGDSVDFLGRLVWPYIDPFVGMQAENANLLAYMVAPALLLSLLQIELRKGLGRYLALGLFLVNFWALLLTKSYTSLAAVFFLVALYVFFKVSRKYKLYVISGLILFSLFFVATQYKTAKFQVLLGKTEHVSSLSRRAQIYRYNFIVLSKNLLVGVGPGAYQSYFRLHQGDVLDVPIPEKELPPHPHNLIFHFAFELGIFGLISILGLYGLTFWKLLNPKENAYFYIFAYFLIHGLLDTPYALEEVSTLFWVFLILAILKSSKEAE